MLFLPAADAAFHLAVVEGRRRTGGAGDADGVRLIVEGLEPQVPLVGVGEFIKEQVHRILDACLGSVNDEPNQLERTEPEGHAPGRSQGGFGTKTHLICDSRGNILAVWVTEGQRHETQGFEEVNRRARLAAPGRPADLAGAGGGRQGLQLRPGPRLAEAAAHRTGDPDAEGPAAPGGLRQGQLPPAQHHRTARSAGSSGVGRWRPASTSWPSTTSRCGSWPISNSSFGSIQKPLVSDCQKRPSLNCIKMG